MMFGLVYSNVDKRFKSVITDTCLSSFSKSGEHMHVIKSLFHYYYEFSVWVV